MTAQTLDQTTIDQTTTETVAASAPPLDWNDLKLVVSIIDLAFERRAFGGLEEIHAILQVRGRIQAVVEYNRPAMEAAIAAAQLQADEAKAAEVQQVEKQAVADTAAQAPKKNTKKPSKKA